MKFHYWALRYVPDVAREEFINVGVVVSDPRSGEGRTRVVNEVSQVPELGSPRAASREAALRSLRSLDQRLKVFSRSDQEIEISQGLSLDGTMSRMQSHMNNLIPVSPRGLIAASNVDDAVNFLYNDLVFRQDAQRRPQYRTRVRKAAIEKYLNCDRLANKVVKRPSVKSTGRDVAIDLAVVDGTVQELSRGFSFAGQVNTQLVNGFDAWTLRAFNLRQAGGTLFGFSEAESLIVSSDVPIIAVTDEPKSKKQRELFQQVTETWKQYGIETIYLEELNSHISELDSQLAMV